MGFFSWLFGTKKISSKINVHNNYSRQKIVLHGDGTFLGEVVGESFYQENIYEICAGSLEEGIQKVVDAQIIPYDDNPYDDKAVKVEISGKIVGHLRMSHARHYRKQLIKDGYKDAVATCKAKIIGGTDFGCFGVVLDLPRPYLEHSEVILEDHHGKEFTFWVERVDLEELKDCERGEVVNLWAPVDSISNVFIFRYGTIGGTGRIGFVPSKFAPVIASHINSENGYYNAVIIDITKKGCKIKVKLESKKEYEDRITKEQYASWSNEDWDNYRKNLTKKYKPQKPVLCYADIDNSKVKAGQKLSIEFASFDHYLDHPNDWYVIFKDSSGKIIYDKGFSQKSYIKPRDKFQRILKAYFNSYKFNVEIINPNKIDKKYFHPQVEIKVTPYLN